MAQGAGCLKASQETDDRLDFFFGLIRESRHFVEWGSHLASDILIGYFPPADWHLRFLIKTPQAGADFSIFFVCKMAHRSISGKDGFACNH